MPNHQPLGLNMYLGFSNATGEMLDEVFPYGVRGRSPQVRNLFKVARQAELLELLRRQVDLEHLRREVENGALPKEIRSVCDRELRDLIAELDQAVRKAGLDVGKDQRPEKDNVEFDNLLADL